MDNRFLLQKNEETEAQIQKLKQLLATNEDVNIELVFQILKNGGVPEELYNQLIDTQLKIFLCLKYQIIEPLKNVKSLIINHTTTWFEQIPPEIKFLKNIELLDLEAQQLKNLPLELNQLSKLRILNLKQNQLTELPEEITQLSNLQKLYLDHNQLQKLPQNIGDLTRLEYLIITSNQLTELPESLAKLSKLRKLVLWDNPLPIVEIQKIRQLLPYTQIKIKP